MGASSQGKVFCVVVTHNGMLWLSKCLSSVLNSNYPVEVIAVDNGSSDGTQEFIKERFPQVDLIETNKNLGFGVSNNIGFKRAMERGSDYVLLLNQDAYLQPETVCRLLPHFFSDSNIALISPTHLNGGGTALDIGFQSCLTEELCPGFISDATLGRLKPRYPIYSVNAATWLLDVKVVNRLGLFSPAFYHYGEDMNFQQRLRYFGYKAIVVTDSYIQHDRDYRNGEKSETGKIHEIKTNQMTLLLNICEPFEVSIRKTFKYAGLLLFEGKFRKGFKIFFDTLYNRKRYHILREEMKKGIPL